MIRALLWASVGGLLAWVVGPIRAGARITDP
jgi:hypothetical protein